MVTQRRLRMRMLRVTTALAVTSWAVVAGAQPEVSEARLRDALLKHFGQDNLLPVFLPRDQRVGDVLQPDGAFFARQATCFPTLKVEARKPSDNLKTVVIDMKSEGNFGIGIKRLVDLFARAGASSTTKLTVSFIDETYVSATSLDLRNNYSAKDCPMLSDIVGNRLVRSDQWQPPLLVLQEVFYARKRLSIDVDKGVNASVVLKDVKVVVQPLAVQADLQASTHEGSRIVVVATQAVPIAVRIAFVPRPVTGTLLGGGGNTAVEDYYWEDLRKRPSIGEMKGLKVVTEAIRSATAGDHNPLLKD